MDLGEQCALEAAMGKRFATDMAMRVTTEAVQILGGVWIYEVLSSGNVYEVRQNSPNFRRNQPGPADCNREGIDQDQRR